MHATGRNHTGDATLLRKVNQSAVLDTIRAQGPISRSDVARRLHLSPPTISRIVTDLIAQGLVSEHSYADSRGGRRPTLLEFNSRANFIIGVYVQQRMVGALADLGGEIVARRTVPSLPGEAGVERLIALIDDLRAEAAALDVPVRGIGVGAPSIVDFHQGTVSWAPALGWRDLPLGRRLHDSLGLPVYVENEINLIALGEHWRGAGRGKQDLVCISLGAGIGAGLILDGHLYRGRHDAAGEVGYLVPNERFLGRTYDTYGCLESLAGSDGILRRAQARLDAGERSVLLDRFGPPDSLTVEAVLNATQSGDALACAVVDETVDYLAIALANLAAILDPELIVITGELPAFVDLFADSLRRRLQGVIPTVPEIVVSELRMDAAVLGAVSIVLRETSGAILLQSARA